MNGSISPIGGQGRITPDTTNDGGPKNTGLASGAKETIKRALEALAKGGAVAAEPALQKALADMAASGDKGAAEAAKTLTRALAAGGLSASEVQASPALQRALQALGTATGVAVPRPVGGEGGGGNKVQTREKADFGPIALELGVKHR
jgi:hypothetical protein